MSELEINYHTWFMQRELSICPKHFVRSNTECTPVARDWILEKLNGRFVISESNVPAFEDPREAVLYELTWG